MLAVALPLIISTASWSVMHFVDRMFLLWYSTETMAAAMPAGILHFALVCLPLGTANYVTAFVAQYHGAGRPERIGLVVWQGARVGLLAWPLLLATIPLAPAFFRFAGHDPQIACHEVLFYQVLTFGAGATIMAGALSGFFTGRGVTWVVMLVDSAAAVLNAVLDYAWIFGRWGFPAMGIEGAGWATVLSQWLRVLVYWRLMMLPRYRHRYGTAAGMRLDRALFGRLLRFGGPNGVQMLVDVAAFAAFILLVGRLGGSVMASTTMAFNVNALAFVPMMGLGLAITTLVGQQLGRNRPDLASRATWNGLGIALAYMGAMAALYVVVPDWFLLGHAAGTAPAEFARLRELTVVLLRFVAAYCLFDALDVITSGALKGAGDTRFIMTTNLVMAVPPITACWLGITCFGAGVLWCWIVITFWIMGLGLTFLGRFLQGRWRQMRVIEPEALGEPGPYDRRGSVGESLNRPAPGPGNEIL